MLYFNAPIFYYYSAYFYRAIFKKFHCFAVCTDDETLISKRLNKGGPFTYRLRFNLPNSSAIQAKQSSSIDIIV